MVQKGVREMAQEPKYKGMVLECCIYAEVEPTAEQKRRFTEFLTKKYKSEGIYIYAIIATFASCITVLTNISIMEISVPIGFGLTTSLIIGGNLLIEANRKEEIRNYLALIFLTAVIGGTFLNLTGLMSSSEFNYAANEAYNNIFSYDIRTYLALTISVIIGILTSTKLYNLMRKNSNKLAVSNILSIIITTIFECIIFMLIAYLYDTEIIDIILSIIFRYIIKVIIGIMGIIPLYIISKDNK